MKYLSEAGPVTCISKWKPCSTETFTKMLHSYHVQFSDEHGNEAFMIKSYKLDRFGDTDTVTIYYARIKDRAVGTPVLLTLAHAKGDRILCFETTEELPPKG